MREYRQALMEFDDYRFGWQSAERGEPLPQWEAVTPLDCSRLEFQRVGWQDFINEECSP